MSPSTPKRNAANHQPQLNAKATTMKVATGYRRAMPEIMVSKVWAIGLRFPMSCRLWLCCPARMERP